MLIKLLAMKDAYLRNEEGATAIEYGLIAAGIAVVISAAVFTFGGELKGLFAGLSGSLKAPGGGGE